MTIGVLGAGQLGRMMALAGYPLAQQFLFLDREAGTPADQVGPSLVGEFTDPKLLDEMAARCEVVTFDWENVPAAALERLASRTRIAPPRTGAGHGAGPAAGKDPVHQAGHSHQQQHGGGFAGGLRKATTRHRPARRAQDKAHGI